MPLEITNLCKSFKKTQALDSITLSIAPGVHGLLGDNGAGKTTLLRILATVLEADSGSIAWDGLHWEKPMQVKTHIGYLPQTFAFYRRLRIKEALKMVAILKNVPKEAIHPALERTHLLPYVDYRISSLSGGTLRRLGLAQAMLGEPKLLLLDEPTVGLDIEERLFFQKTIREYAAGERIVLMSCHIAQDIVRTCDSISILHKGKVLASGALSQFQNDKISLEESYTHLLHGENGL